MMQPERPGGATAGRDMHFFWLLDGSGSMTGAKVQQLNYAVAQAIPEMRLTAAENPTARVLMHALRFASDVKWISQTGKPSQAALEPVPLSEFEWGDFIKAEGETAMGKVLSLVAEELGELESRKGHYYAPVIILVTDGYATDLFDDGLRQLMAQKLGKNAIRLAVAIGDQVDMGRLKKFIDNDEIRVIEASNADDLAKQIAFVSRTGIERSSRPSSRPALNQWIDIDAPRQPES